MKSLLLLLSFCLLSASFCPAQEISLEKDYWSGYKFYQNGNKLSHPEVERLLANHAETLSLYKQHRKSKLQGDILRLGGGFLIGWQLGSLINGNGINVVGGALGIIATIVSIAPGKKAKEAAEDTVNSYNKLYRERK